jgi:hypothetical protein
MEHGVGSKALTSEGCRGRQSRGAVVALSSFRCSCAMKKGEGGGEGCCDHGESKRDAVDVGIHQVWAIHSSACGQGDATCGRPEG